MQTRRSRRPGESRRGFQVLELLFAIPVLFGLLIAALAYQRLLVVESGVTQAAIAGAREAGKGADDGEIACVVRHVLAAYGLAVDDRSDSVLVQHGGQADGGEAACDDRAAPAPGQVRVVVRVALGGGRGLLDALAAAFHGEPLCASSLVSHEGPRS